jgi:hypothetical protein
MHWHYGTEHSKSVRVEGLIEVNGYYVVWKVTQQHTHSIFCVIYTRLHRVTSNVAAIFKSQRSYWSSKGCKCDVLSSGEWHLRFRSMQVSSVSGSTQKIKVSLILRNVGTYQSTHTHARTHSITLQTTWVSNLVNISCNISASGIRPRRCVRYIDTLRDGGSGDRILVGSRFPVTVQNGPGAHPASCTMGTGPPVILWPGACRWSPTPIIAFMAGHYVQFTTSLAYQIVQFAT